MSERAYLDLLQDILDNGSDRGDRTGTGTRSVFGRQIRFDLSKGFPLLTTKKVFLKGVIHELLWFLRGSTNAKELEDVGVNIWKQWGDPETRELGPVYGKQWRSWFAGYEAHALHFADENRWDRLPQDAIDLAECDLRPIQIDQIADLVNRLKTDPNSRRHLVVAWNPGEVDQMALPPCHCLFQFYVRPLTVAQREAIAAQGECWTFGGIINPTEEQAHDELDRRGNGWKVPRYALDCQLYQRSGDCFLGVPFNVASYSLLTMMLAQQLGYAAGEFVHTFGDVHLYHNHFDQAREQLSREPYTFPQMNIRKADDIFSYAFEDFILVNYKSHPTIKAPVAV